MDSEPEPGALLELPEGEERHIRKVLRGYPGDTFEVVDARRRLFLAQLREDRGAAILEEVDTVVDYGIEVALYQAVPKGKHMDLVVEKATELGVNRIVPLVTERGVVRIEDQGKKKVERWRRVAEAAARQSLQLHIPEVDEPAVYKEAVREADGQRIVLHNDAAPPIEEIVASSPVSLFVGPEGGWSEEDIWCAREAGSSLAQLGPYRLRSETAGIVGVARARAALENLLHSTKRGA